MSEDMDRTRTRAEVCGLLSVPVPLGAHDTDMRTKNLLGKLISTALVSGLEVSMSWRDKWQQLLGCGGTGVKPAIAQLGQRGRVLASWGAHRRAVTQRCCHPSLPRDELKEQRPGSNETLPLTTGLQRVCSLPGPGTCCELMLG